MLMLVLLSLIIYKPLYISFYDEMYEKNLNRKQLDLLFYQIPLVFFIIDLIFNFNTSYYDKGNLVMDRTKIMGNYFKNNFLWDFIIYVSFMISI